MLPEYSHNVVRMQSECSQIVVRMQLECSQNVVRRQSECCQSIVIMQSECSPNVVGMQLECSQKAVRMLPEYSQNDVRMWSECSQNVVRMQLECSQNVVRFVRTFTFHSAIYCVCGKVQPPLVGRGGIEPPPPAPKARPLKRLSYLDFGNQSQIPMGYGYPHRLQSECSQNVEKCSQNVVSMVKECSQNVVRMQLESNRNVVRMQSARIKSEKIRIQPECSHCQSLVVVGSH